uniref:Ketosteroid isomerase-like protein n=1 Tax=Caulobacter sp. (strain K31) TaxID=366602 RepID=B0T3P4_CAUSK
MGHDNQSIVQRGYDCFVKGDLDGLFSTMTDDVQWSVVGPPDAFPLFGERSGREGAAEYFRQLGEILDITSISPNRFLSDGDTVVVLGHTDGVMRKTGEPVRTQWVHVFTLRDDQIASYQEFVDTTVLMKAQMAA